MELFVKINTENVCKMLKNGNIYTVHERQKSSLEALQLTVYTVQDIKLLTNTQMF